MDQCSRRQCSRCSLSLMVPSPPHGADLAGPRAAQLALCQRVAGRGTSLPPDSFVGRGLAVPTTTGRIVVVQEGRFRLITDRGQARLFLLAADAPLEP